MSKVSFPSAALSESTRAAAHRDPEGRFHNQLGPAVVTQDGSRYYFIHGELHREAGPAYISSSGYTEWYLHNHKVEPFTPEQLPLILLNLSL